MQGPERFLTELGLELPGAVHPEAPAILDPEHRVFVNSEVYFFSSLAAKAEFLERPYAHCGRVTDPVTQERFQPGSDSPSRIADGRLLYFASQQNAERFDLQATGEPR